MNQIENKINFINFNNVEIIVPDYVPIDVFLDSSLLKEDSSHQQNQIEQPFNIPSRSTNPRLEESEYNFIEEIENPLLQQSYFQETFCDFLCYDNYCIQNSNDSEDDELYIVDSEDDMIFFMEDI